jgi:uncharacterized protein YeaO (DUF488 family)
MTLFRDLNCNKASPKRAGCKARDAEYNEAVVLKHFLDKKS